jgi:hypothetical protein
MHDRLGVEEEMGASGGGACYSFATMERLGEGHVEGRERLEKDWRERGAGQVRD